MAIAPGSLWLSYNLRDTAALRAMMPPDVSLARVSLLGDAPHDRRYRLLYNAYTLDARPYMEGVRVDVQTMGYHTVRKTWHLVVLDCLTTCLAWDPVRGIALPNARAVRVETTQDAEYGLQLDGRRANAGQRFRVQGRRTRKVPVSHRFAVEANRVCFFANHARPFPMAFDEATVARPVTKLRLESVENDLWADYREPRPTHGFVHDHAMAFDVETPTWFF